MAADLPPGIRCKFCPATIVRVPKEVGGDVLLDPEPVPNGAWVVVEDSTGFTAHRYVYVQHLHRPRYQLHTNRCRPTRGAPTPARKADPTAGMAFPKRPPRQGEVGPFPPLEQLLGVRRGR